MSVDTLTVNKVDINTIKKKDPSCEESMTTIDGKVTCTCPIRILSEAFSNDYWVRLYNSAEKDISMKILTQY